MLKTGLFILFALIPLSHAGSIRIAAAADLRYAMGELINVFQSENPGETVEAIYGSSGKFATQIQHGAPFDLFFSADISYPGLLEKKELTASAIYFYAIGRLVVWSMNRKLEIGDLGDKTLHHISIANPQHAPYGVRAKEALVASGLWSDVESRLVMGENIAQAAQFVESGAASAGLIALSLVLSPALKDKGQWTFVDDNLHQPLEQGFVILQRAKENMLAYQFAEFIVSQKAKRVMEAYGFVIPAESSP